MSRTFRCRHLPMPSGGGHYVVHRARRIIDGGSFRYSWSQVRRLAEAHVTALLGPRPEVRSRMVYSKGLTHKVYCPLVQELRRVYDMKLPVTVRPAYYEVRPGRRMTTHEAWEWERAVDQFMAEVVIPVSSWHPYQRHSYAGGAKKAERVGSNRFLRRRTRAILRTEVVDDDWNGSFPSKNDYFDWWDIY